MNLSDALGDWPSGGNNQSGGGGPWPGQPANPTWPNQPSANPTWPGGPAGGGGGAWPGGPAGGPAGGGGAWPGGPAGGQAGGGGAWPGGPAGGPAGGGGAWPGGPATGPAGGGGAWPSGGPNQPAWPSPTPQPSAPGPGPAVPVAPQQNLSVPYSQNLPSGVYDKLLITIAGVIKPNADKITVDLSTSHDLAFHFNPRFNESGRKVIVRNSCIGKKWGKEERELQNFPFVQGQPFEIKIMCTNREFKVAVNNSHLLEYKHRITDLRSINKLNIYYDLNLSRVNMETLP